MRMQTPTMVPQPSREAGFRDVEVPDRRGGPTAPPLRHEWQRIPVGPPFRAPYVYVARIDDSTVLQVIRAGSYWSWLVIAFHPEHGALVGGHGSAPTLGWGKARAELRLGEVRREPQQQIWSTDERAADEDGGVPF